MITVISNSFITAQIKHSGAELFSLKSNETDKEYMWEGNPEFWGKHSPVLFPIVGMLKNNRYYIDNTEYHLPRHGFARDFVFELINKTENNATFSIQSSAETLKVYPFEFELQICYTLDEKNLNIEYKVINKNKFKMPFSIGAHPAFTLNGNFEDYAIEFEKEEPLVYSLLEDNLISNKTNTLEHHNKTVKLNYQLFENDALIFKSLESKKLSILKNSVPHLKVNFQDFPHLGIWTVKNAPFTCIEPWFGYSDSIETNGNLFEKEGIQILEKEKTFKAEFTIEII